MAAPTLRSMPASIWPSSRGSAQAYPICGIDCGPRARQHGAVIARVEPRRFTVKDYHCMTDTHILTEADRVELIDGEIVPVTWISRRRAPCVAQFTRRLTQALGDRALVWPRNTIRLPSHSEPPARRRDPAASLGSLSPPPLARRRRPLAHRSRQRLVSVSGGTTPLNERGVVHRFHRSNALPAQTRAPGDFRAQRSTVSLFSQ